MITKVKGVKVFERHSKGNCVVAHFEGMKTPVYLTREVLQGILDIADADRAALETWIAGLPDANGRKENNARAKYEQLKKKFEAA